jgi:hypothetical protein
MVAQIPLGEGIEEGSGEILRVGVDQGEEVPPQDVPWPDILENLEHQDNVVISTHPLPRPYPQVYELENA